MINYEFKYSNKERSDFYFKHFSGKVFYNKLMITIEFIAKDKDSNLAVESFCYFPEIKQFLNKEKILLQIKTLIEDGKYKDNSPSLLPLFGFERKSFKFNQDQLTAFKNLYSLFSQCILEGCDHKNLAIIPLLHGGGFTPTFSLPEVICTDCWLNVTLYKEPKNFGLKISDKDYLLFQEFVKKCNKHFLKIYPVSSSEINKNPEETYIKSQKYFNDYKIEIVDKKLFESFSGI